LNTASSVAKQLRCGGILRDHFYCSFAAVNIISYCSKESKKANLTSIKNLQYFTVLLRKKFENFNILQSYKVRKLDGFLFRPLCIIVHMLINMSVE